MDDEAQTIDDEALKNQFKSFVAGVPTVEELGLLMRSLGHNPSDAELSSLVVDLKTADAFSSMMLIRERPVEDEIPQLITRLHQDISKTKAKGNPDLMEHIRLMMLERAVLALEREVLKQKVQRLEAAEGIQKEGADNEGDDGLAPMPPGVEDTLRAAWEKTYEVSPVVDYILQTLDGYAEQWSQPAYESPWTCMIQSSGWGKSRTICQLSSHGVYVIYISFRDSAFPRGTPGAKEYFKSVKGDVRKIAAAFVGCMFRLSDELEKRGSSPGEWVSMQTSPKRSNFWQEHRWGMLEEEVSALPKRTHSDVTLDEWGDNPLKAWVESCMNKFNVKTGLKVKQKGLKVLFCLDEAGSLFAEEEKLFVTMRRAFSCFPRGERTFAVLMDTSAQLQILAPSRLANPSLKGRLPETKIFAPLCLAGVPWFSCCKDLKSGRCGIDKGDEATRMLFSVGRPLWRACLQGQPEKEVLATQIVVSYAVQKLLGGRSLTDASKRKPLDEDMAIGILGASIGIEVVAWSSLAQTLVASHMRTAVVVSEERDRLVSADTVEPILGEAAAQVLRTEGMLLKVLNALEAVCKQAYVLEGPRGELVGRLILLLTMHECLKVGGTFSWPVPLQEFLSKLCGKEVKCTEGLVFFNRCCVVSGELTQKVLLQCYLGCFAVIPRRNQEGYDFVIPVLYAAEDGRYVLEEKYMGAIPCQFRDRDSYGVQAGALNSWSKHFEFSGYVKKRKQKSDDIDVSSSRISLTAVEVSQQRTDDDDEELLDADEDPDPVMYDDDEYIDFLLKEQEKFSASLQRSRENSRQKRQKGIEKNEEITKLMKPAEGSKRNGDEGIALGKAVGLYFHLNSRRKCGKEWVVQIEQTVIFHGIRTFSYFDKEVINRLEVLRYAYHKLDNMAKSHLELMCMKHVAWPYFSFFDD